MIRLQAVAKLETHRGWVRSAAFAPDGQQLATGGEDNRVVLWNVADWTVQQSLPQEGFINALAYSPCGNWLGIATMDGHLQLLHQGEQVLSVHARSGVNALALNASLLAGGFGDGLIRLFELPGLKEIPGFRINGHISAVAWMADGNLAACSPMQNDVMLWRREGEREVVGRMATGRIRCLTALPEGGLAVGDNQGRVRVMPGDLHSLDSGGGAIQALAANAAWLAAGCQCSMVRLWNRQTYEQTRLEGHQGEVSALSLSPTQPLLVSGSQDCLLRVWSLED